MSKKRQAFQLANYDSFGDGYLREQDLERFIAALCKGFPQTAQMTSNQMKYYLYHAVRKFMFFLDTNRRGRIAQQDILQSPLLDEINQLKTTTPVVASKNWFSLQFFQRLYSRYCVMTWIHKETDQYCMLDLDRNGRLSQKELSKLNNGSLTDTFIERIFQEYPTKSGELVWRLEF